MPSPYDRLNGNSRRGSGRRRKASKQGFDILFAVAVLLVGLAIGAIRGSLPGASRSGGTQGSAQTSQQSGKSGKSRQSGNSGQGQKDSAPDSASGPAAGDAAADLTGDVEATTVLDHLPVKGRAPKTGYSRSRFGAAWADVDHNGCDTRNDVLNRDLTQVTHREGTHGCVVLSGVLDDPYTGKTIDFRRGRRTSEAVQIDHVVALSDAWQTGAQRLSADRREQLANDPYNLLAVDGPSNQQKSDSDAASWLPSNKQERCPYVARQIGVKRKYGLWVTAAEKDAMKNVLSSCPAQKVMRQ